MSPRVALSVGLKVDADALPQSVKDGIANGSVNLDSPATTVALIKLDAVVGLKGEVVTEGGVDRLRRVGTTCALCHSTVDDSFSAGIGKRLDGWPNRSLNPGAIRQVLADLRVPEQWAKEVGACVARHRRRQSREVPA